MAQDDFTSFTHLMALNRQDLSDIEAIAPADGTARTGLLLNEVGGRAAWSVADPYTSGPEPFEKTWRAVTLTTHALAAKLAAAA